MVEIKFEIDKNRCVAVENKKLVGKCEYLVENDVWNIIHTGVSQDYQGLGIAKKLVLEVIKEAKNHNKKLMAACSYAQKVINNL